MSFTIRNHGSALYEDQSEIDALDWSIVIDALNGNGVFTGCQTTAQTSPDGSVLVSAGTYRVNASNKTCAGGSVSVVSGSANTDGSTALAADANYPRYDLIVMNFSNQLGVIHGTVPNPVFPDFVINPVFPTYSPTTQIVIAAVYVTPALTAIATGNITPKDVKINVDAVYDRTHLMSSTTYHSGEITNAQHGIRSVASAHAAGQIVFTPVGSIAATDVQAAIAELLAELTTEVTFSKAGTLATGTGVFRWYNDTGRTLTFVSTRASVTTAPTGSPGAVTVDINKNGTTIFTTQASRPSIAASGFTDQGSTPDVTTIANGDYLTADIDAVGATIAGADLTIQIFMKG